MTLRFFGIGLKVDKVAISEMGNDYTRGRFSEWMGVRAEVGV